MARKAAVRTRTEVRTGGAPRIVHGSDEGREEHRDFPRAQMAARFELWIGEGAQRRFSAVLRAVNLSISGAFLESSFFLPVGTELSASFVLEDGQPPIQARAQVVRQQREGERGRPMGFGIRFLEFAGQTDISVAKLFLGAQLREFAQGYLQSKRAKSIGNELDRLVDALAGWELARVTTGEDPWRQQ